MKERKWWAVEQGILPLGSRAIVWGGLLGNLRVNGRVVGVCTGTPPWVFGTKNEALGAAKQCRMPTPRSRTSRYRVVPVVVRKVVET